MTILFKKIISFSLLLCFSSKIVHNHSHFHSHKEKISIEVFENQNNEHHISLKECDQCLTKNNNSEVQCTNIDVFNASLFLYQYKFYDYIKYFFTYNLYSRPPPTFTT